MHENYIQNINLRQRLKEALIYDANVVLKEVAEVLLESEEDGSIYIADRVGKFSVVDVCWIIVRGCFVLEFQVEVVDDTEAYNDGFEIYYETNFFADGMESYELCASEDGRVGAFCTDFIFDVDVFFIKEGSLEYDFEKYLSISNPLEELSDEDLLGLSLLMAGKVVNPLVISRVKRFLEVEILLRYMGQVDVRGVLMFPVYSINRRAIVGKLTNGEEVAIKIPLVF